MFSNAPVCAPSTKQHYYWRATTIDWIPSHALLFGKHFIECAYRLTQLLYPRTSRVKMFTEQLRASGLLLEQLKEDYNFKPTPFIWDRIFPFSPLGFVASGNQIFFGLQLFRDS